MDSQRFANVVLVDERGWILLQERDEHPVIDPDKWADAYADMLGVDPELIVSSEDVAIVRQQRAEAEAQAQQMAQIQMQAEAAQKLGTVKTGGEPNAASDIINMFSGYQSPSGTEL